MYKEHKQQSGFTLIELMIVVVIIGILTSIMLLSLRDSQERKIVDVNVRQVTAVIRATQNYAVNGRIEQSDKIPCEYRFVITSPNTYKIQYTYHSPTDMTCSSTATDVAVYHMMNGVTIAPIPSSISFALPLGMPDVAQTIAIHKGSTTKNICIRDSGYIDDGC